MFAFKSRRARIQRHFLLTITANEKLLIPPLTANELAIIGAGLHSMAACSHYLKMKTAIRAELDVAFPSKSLSPVYHSSE